MKYMIDYISVVFMINKQLKGSLFLLFATVIWGSAFVSQDVAMEHMGPFTFQAIRCFMAVLALLPVIWLFDRSSHRHFIKEWANKKLWSAGILCGIPLFLACNLQQLGLVDSGAGKSGFLTAMYIVMVPIIGIIRRKPFSPMIPISVVIAVAGLYCLTGVSGQLMLSDMLLLGCALAFAVQITFVDLFARSVDPLRLNTIQAFVCAVLTAVLAIFLEKDTPTDLASSILPIIHVGVLSMGVAYSIQIIAQKDLEPATASLIMSLESVFALFFGWMILKEELSAWEWLGCGLIFVAVILSQINIKKKAAPVS